MNRNSENHFGAVPTVNIERSVFHTPKPIRTTFNAGVLVPIYINQDITPGDTFQMKGTFVIRQSTPITPTMDMAYADVFAFFQRNFNLWDHWKEFWGENTTGAWTQETVYSVPQMIFDATHNILKGDLADHWGLPLTSFTGEKTTSVSRLPWTMNIQVWNNFFRAQNLEAPAYEPTGDEDVYTIADSERGNATYDDWLNLNINTQTTLQCKPAPVNKAADYYTTAMPEPQKGPAVTMPVGSDSAPLTGYGQAYGTGNAMGMIYTNGGNLKEGGMFIADSGDWGKGSVAESYLGDAVSDGASSPTGSKPTSNSPIGLNPDKTKSEIRVDLSNVVADLSSAFAATINAQRLAFATQRIFERDAFGSRYFESIKNFFHVTSPYGVQTIPEYLGGFRIGIEQTQVAQTSESGTTPQGNVAAYSLTVSQKHIFTKSFTEHGILMLYITVRNKNSYDQGIEPQWTRKLRLDYYHPQLQYLGFKGIKNKEIFLQGTAQDEEIFGYQERWAEMKYERAINSGAFHTTYAQSLKYWHYGDQYNSLPVLSGQWSISAAKQNIDRTLAVTSEVEDQYIMDCLLDITSVRPICAWGVPGLLDHY